MLHVIMKHIHCHTYNYYIKEKIYHNKIKETYSNLFVFARKQKHKFSVGLLTKWQMKKYNYLKTVIKNISFLTDLIIADIIQNL